MKQMKGSGGGSRPTGRYVFCQFSPGPEHSGRLCATPVMKGPKVYFTKCITCGTKAFIGRGMLWSDGKGYTHEEAVKMGAMILAPANG